MERKMRQNLTEIVVIMDRSGSMTGIMDEAIGSFNTFIDEQRAQPGEATVTLAIFDDRYDLLHDSINVKDVPKLTSKECHARGMTALLDAVGDTITNVGAKLASTKEKVRPGKVIVLIITDGEENASKRYNAAKIQAMITEQKTKYSWEFLFMVSGGKELLDGHLKHNLGEMNFNANTVRVNEHTKDGYAASMQFMARSVANYRASDANDDSWQTITS